MFNRRRLPRKLLVLQSQRDKIAKSYSMPLVRQVEILLHDSYQDTTLTTTHLMSIIVVCLMYLRSRALPDYLRDKLMQAVDYSESMLQTEGLMNPRTLERWNLDIATRNPLQGEGANQQTIDQLVDEFKIPDDLSEENGE